MQSWVFQFRWLEWVFGVGVLLIAASRTGKLGLQSKARTEVWLKKVDLHVQKAFWRTLAWVCVSYFVLATVGKILQLQSLNLHGQDFWLFVDILEQMKKGGFFLTRFAPQAIGYVQHGAVHPMWTWGFLLPLSALIGSVPVALIFNPAALAAAGGMVSVLSRKRWGESRAILLSLAFLFSTQVGKILNYEVHPEALYPFLGLLWLWALGLDGTRKVRPWALGFATVALIGVKEDSFLIVGPALAWVLASRSQPLRKGLVLTGALAAFCIGFQVLLVRLWSTGALGPLNWSGSPVTFHSAAGVFNGKNWSGSAEISEILTALVEKHGGVFGVFQKFGNFLVSRPWWSLLILAPWVVLQKRFWILIFPLAFAYSLLDGPNILWTYYSAPFLIGFWFCAVSPDFKGSPRKSYVLWALAASIFIGSGGIQWAWPSKAAKQVQEQARKLVPCAGEYGLVPSYLIPWVPLEKVWTDRIPVQDVDWRKIDFVLFSPLLGSYELPEKDSRQLYERLRTDPEWTAWSQNCTAVEHLKPLDVGPVEVPTVLLFKRILR